MISSSFLDSIPPSFKAPVGPQAKTVGEVVEQIIRRAADVRNGPERRLTVRHAYPELVRVTPADTRGNPTGDPVSVVGKHISHSGFGFFHNGPLPEKYVIAEFQSGEQTEHLLLNLVWCRFLREGWYDSGGKFVSVVDLQQTDQPPRLIG
ncbi:MAG: hypothetical protein AAF497_05595 [Planctomycetota bacterium]